MNLIVYSGKVYLSAQSACRQSWCIVC